MKFFFGSPGTDAKKFYRQLGKETIEIKDPPETQEVETFWKNIWSNKKGFDADAVWITREEARMGVIEKRGWEDITTKELKKKALTKAYKWKSPRSMTRYEISG